jgi:hypothetical protein
MDQVLSLKEQQQHKFICILMDRFFGSTMYSLVLGGIIVQCGVCRGLVPREKEATCCRGLGVVGEVL